MKEKIRVVEMSIVSTTSARFEKELVILDPDEWNQG